MSMSGSGLATAITNIPGITINDSAALLAFCNALINYITTNAQVNSGITVQVNTGSGSGATTGTGSVS